MAKSVSIKQLDDITECPICTDVYTDPRVLPCIHTYCLKCIEEYGKEKNPGDQIACPMCRNECVVPEKGLGDLPRNLFVNRLLDVKKVCALGEQKGVHCDVCGSDMEDDSIVSQRSYNVLCGVSAKILQRVCSKYHRKMKGTSDHQQVEIASEQLAEDIIKKLPISTCEKHVKKKLELYCLECKVAVCIVCFAELHKMHDCSDIEKVYQELNKQIGDDVDAVGTRIAKYDETLKNWKRKV